MYNTSKMTLALVALAMSVSACDFIECDIIGDCPVSDDAVELPIFQSRQQTEVWCWAATSEMVLQYYNVQTPQCEILSKYTGFSCCFSLAPVCYQAAPSLQTIQAVLRVEGRLNSTVTGRLSYSQVKREIDAGRPLIVAYQGSFNGHVVVIYGYDPKHESLLIHDPFYGTFSPRYARALSYGQSNLVWTNTITNIRR